MDDKIIIATRSELSAVINFAVLLIFGIFSVFSFCRMEKANTDFVLINKYFFYGLISAAVTSVCGISYIRIIKKPFILLYIQDGKLILNGKSKKTKTIALDEITDVIQLNARARLFSYSFGKLTIVCKSGATYTVNDIDDVDSAKTNLLMNLPRKND